MADAHRSVLGLSFKDRLGELITEFRPTQTRLLPFFSNLLPRRTHAHVSGVARRRERGARVLPAVGAGQRPAGSRHRRAGRGARPGLSMSTIAMRPDRPGHANALRFSLAGVQLKFSAIEEERGGLTIPVRGVGGSWIVKLPSREFEGVPENEFAMMTLARLIGMDVPALQLIDLDAIGNLPREIGCAEGTRALPYSVFDRDSRTALPFMSKTSPRSSESIPRTSTKKASARNIAGVIGDRGRYNRHCRVHSPPHLQHSDRQCRHAPQELVSDLSRQASRGSGTCLRFCLYHSLHPGRQGGA